ncbi:MAG: prepilin peptidase [Patescibacteria group bacterium]
MNAALLWYGFFFALGTIVGSFINAATLRFRVRSLRGRSFCPACGETLHWFELIPLASFFIQNGRCRACSSRISRQYPLVELTTGLVFAAIFWKHLPALVSSGYSVIQLFSYESLVLVLELLVWSLLMAISVYDLRHKIIPDALVYGFLFFSFLVLLSTSNFQLPTFNSLNFWSGFLLAAPFAAVWFFSRGRAMGLGDAKLVLSFPWFVGLPLGVSAVVLGFWLGAFVAALGFLLKAASSFSLLRALPALNAALVRLTMKTELPLAPFLALGLFLVYVFGWDVTGLSLLLQPTFNQ